MPVAGNPLGRIRKNFFLSKHCILLLQYLTFKTGLTEAGVVEMAVRELAKAQGGEVPTPEWLDKEIKRLAKVFQG